jgi:molybdopterin-guanine dinucleotide biosynthesis protein A
MPVCLFIKKNLLVRLKEIEQAEGMSLRYLVEADRVLQLKPSSIKAFINVNTPEDWLELNELTE